MSFKSISRTENEKGSGDFHSRCFLFRSLWFGNDLIRSVRKRHKRLYSAKAHLRRHHRGEAVHFFVYEKIFLIFAINLSQKDGLGCVGLGELKTGVGFG